jgi:imidazolonepropionase-like amidohydrolase
MSKKSSSEPSMANTLICTGRKVLYAGTAVPQPATITIDTETGKITEILPFYQTRGVHETRIDEDDVTWIDAGDMVVLPGLVECVAPSMTRKSNDILPTVPTSIWMNPV